METQKIVVRYLDGRVMKGQTSNFSPAASSFTLIPRDAGPAQKSVIVAMKTLKAVFFVRDFTGHPNRHDCEDFPAGQPYQGHKVEVEFSDGEVLRGYTANYDQNMPGFFVFPADPNSNTIKAFAVAANVREVRLL